MPDQDQWFDFQDLRGGRNGGDPPGALSLHQVNEALNVDYQDGLIGRKRGGATSLSLTFSSGGPFTTGIQSLLRYIPSFNEAAAELWAVDGGTGLIGRLAGAATWVPAVGSVLVTVNNEDLVASGYRHLAQGVSFNRQLFLFYNTVYIPNRCHLWNGTNIIRAGLAMPYLTVLSSIATSAGAVTDTRRYWASVVHKSGATYLRRSELSSTYLSQALTAQRSTVTLGGGDLPAEGETHWELWAASAVNGYATQHYIGEAATGVTIVDNNATLTGLPPAPVGTYLLPPGAKYAIADGDRLILGGSYVPTPSADAVGTYQSLGQTIPKSNRVWWTPRLGDRDISDDIRIPVTIGSSTVPAIRNYLDVDEEITGIGGPFDGNVYVFSYRRIWRLEPTGIVSKPYERKGLAVPYGCIFSKSICLGEDESGQQALYFASRQGICRIDNQGPVFCGWDNQDLWATINLAATVPVFCQYHADIKQLWVWIATASSDTPDTRLVFHVLFGSRDPRKGVTGGWVKHTGLSCQAWCGAMFANTVGASMSRDLKPYIGRSSGTTILKCDTTDLDDAGTSYQAYIERVLAPPLESSFRLGNAWILAKAASGVTLRHSLTADFGDQAARTADLLLTAAGSETRIFRQIEDSALSGIKHSATARIGDAAAVANRWVLDRWKLAVDPEQPN